MIERAIEIKSLLNHLVTNLPILTNNWPTSEEWSTLNDLLDLLAPFALTTKVISASSYPTIGEVKWYFLGIKNHLEQSHDSNYSLQSQVGMLTVRFDPSWSGLHRSAVWNRIANWDRSVLLDRGLIDRSYRSVL